MRRKGSSPIRVIIEATYPTADHKQKSRWVRALEFAAEEKTPAKELIELFRSRGGIAGCAAHAAKLAPKRTVSRDDWAPRNKKTYVEAAAKRRSEKPASAVRAEDKLTWMSWFDPD
jgi:hypothetical protein